MVQAVVLFLAWILPPIVPQDAFLFPGTAEYARESWLFGVHHCEHLARFGMTGTIWYAEADYCRRCWDIIDDVKGFYRDRPADLVRKLTALRTLLGPQDFYAGRMPPPGPYWRFTDR